MNCTIGLALLCLWCCHSPWTTETAAKCQPLYSQIFSKQGYMKGPGKTPLNSDYSPCEDVLRLVDYDGDRDVDLRDYAEFQRYEVTQP